VGSEINKKNGLGIKILFSAYLLFIILRFNYIPFSTFMFHFGKSVDIDSDLIINCFDLFLSAILFTQLKKFSSNVRIVVKYLLTGYILIIMYFTFIILLGILIFSNSDY